MTERVEPVLVGAGADDAFVELGRAVQVVVVVVQPGVLQGLGLLGLKHAQGHAGFQAQRADLAHHLGHPLHVALFRAAPGRAHAKTGGALVLGGLGGLHHLGQWH